MSLIIMVNLIISLQNKILTTNKAEKKKTIQYKRMILFVNKVKIK
jgi:hypothetical protein